MSRSPSQMQCGDFFRCHKIGHLGVYQQYFAPLQVPQMLPDFDRARIERKHFRVYDRHKCKRVMHGASLKSWIPFLIKFGVKVH